MRLAAPPLRSPWSCALLTTVLAIFVVPALPAQPLTDAVRQTPQPPPGDPVAPGLWRLAGNDPSLPLDDLEPLRQMIGNASVVGMGESIHTSGGFYRMKHRMFRFLVERMGFRVLAFEDNWQDAGDRVESFVQTCEGTPKEAMRGMFGVWQSAELGDLLQWMCEWNQAHPKAKDKLHFMAFDVQQPHTDGTALIAYLKRTGTPEDDPWIQGVRACDRVVTSWDAGTMPPEPHEQCLQALAQIEEHFQTDARILQRLTSKTDLAVARLRVVGLRGWEDETFNWHPPYSTSNTARDEAMAYSFLTLRSLRYPKAKMALWAHNAHISRTMNVNFQAVSIGSLLVKALGKAYVSVGLVSLWPSIDWPGNGCSTWPLRLDHSVEEAFDAAGLEAALADLDVPSLFPPGGHYFLGSYFQTPRDNFDALIYLQLSSKMTPYAWPSCE